MMERLGWTLVQFLWQGALIAGTYAAVRRAMRAAESRYLLACAAMAAMMLAPLATFFYLGRGTSSTGAVANGASAVEVATVPGTAWQADSWTQVVPWLAVAWVAGVVLLLGRLAGGWWLTSRLRTQGARPVTADSGKPPASDLALTTMSGAQGQRSQANHVPVRPAPVCTSSAISRMPCRSTISRRPAMNSFGAT